MNPHFGNRSLNWNTLFVGIVCVLCLVGLSNTAECTVVQAYFQVEELTDRTSQYRSPMDYLMSAEIELAARDADMRFVIESLVRAVYRGVELGDHRIASSACIALAGIMEDESEQDWLWDLALSIDSSREVEWVARRARSESAEDSVRLDAAVCLYAIRYHQHPLATELWNRPEVRQEILSVSEQIDVQLVEVLRVLEQELSSGAADSCRGRLFIADRANPGQRVACPDHLRALGMSSNDQNLAIMLRLEMVLNDLVVNTWSASVSMSLDEPVILPSLGQLLKRYAVDPELGFYRDGEWVDTP